MRFLVDAQLPRRIVRALCARGHDARHTVELPAGNRTSDQEILIVAQRDGCVVVTKDDDFVRSHVLLGQPEKLLLIATGNIANDTLESLLLNHLDAIESALSRSRFVELRRELMIVHD